MAALASGPPPSLQVTAPDTPPFSEQEVSLGQIRATLAYLLFGLFALSVLVALVYVGNQESWDRAKEFLQIAVPAELGLLGAAIGFYFGAQSQRDTSGGI